ncbi:MAG TPA: hypothetical protein VFW52_03205, partial [Candidatus Saccharimonadales bacterium]|nr:hypothetical protein [Candidatus Saccharimonadales bacterium]
MKNVNLILQKLKRPMFGIAVFVFSVLSYSPSIAALSQAERDSIYKDTVWYKTNASIQCGTAAASDGTLGSGAPGGSYGSDQLKAFATTPISSTWNISDSTVEKWFLSQTNATPVILRYGLNAGNIGAITSAVKAAGVSPVFFYAYTVSEGGASNGRNLGFINHTDRSGLSAVAAATADAQYLADASKIMTSKPSWIDAGNPVDFVPQEVKDAGDADFQKMPSGSIGRAYIPATAAAAWEVYYPDGLKKEYNQVQDYGSPLQNVMQDIKSMGGDPMQGGTTIPSGVCEGGTGVAGEGMTKAINWAVMIANNDGYGYDSSAARTTGWVKWQSDPNCTNQ